MDTRVGLIYMPFADISYPSLGLSLLKSILDKHGILSRIHYLNFKFAERVNYNTYDEIVKGAPRTFDLVGEWIFSSSLWGEDANSDKNYISEVLFDGLLPDCDQQFLNNIKDCRNQVEEFLQYCLMEVPWAEYKVVGFSSTFQQQIAALSLAKRVKALYPDIFIIFGGPNVEGTMGEVVVRHFPFVDAVCNGEGDKVFPELVRGILEKRPFKKINGIIYKKDANRFNALREDINLLGQIKDKTKDLNELPFPDFDDFFHQYSESSTFETINLKLVLETSRGCWWGMKSHCTFCGLNSTKMIFRSKSAERSIEEILYLLSKYGKYSKSFIVVDNILPFEYFKTFLPKVRDLNLDIDLFYETKSNLNENLIQLFYAAGLKTIQPGIESLSTEVLRLMKKGVTSIQNIQLLKLCRQYDIQPIWNILVGFPNEKPEYYQDVGYLIYSITHLFPPNGVARIRFDRFSPYFDKPLDFNVRNLHPYPSYKYIYPLLDNSSLYDIAYYFVGEFDGQALVDEYTLPLRSAVIDWKENHKNSNLFYLTLENTILFYDTRFTKNGSISYISGRERYLFKECNSITSKAILIEKYLQEFKENITIEELDIIMKSLIDLRVVISEDNFYLNLAIPLN